MEHSGEVTGLPLISVNARRIQLTYICRTIRNSERPTVAKKSRKVPVETDEGFHPLSSLRTEVEHVFERLARAFVSCAATAAAERGCIGIQGRLRVIDRAAGMDAGDVKLRWRAMSGCMGEKHNEHEEKDATSTGGTKLRGFQAGLRLLDDADKKRVSAEFSKGVRRITYGVLPALRSRCEGSR